MRLAALTFSVLLVSCQAGKRQPEPCIQASATAGQSSQPPKASAEPAKGDERHATQVEIHHVIFYEGSGLRLRVEWLRGRMYAVKPDTIPSFDLPESFETEVSDGSMSISLPDLSALLNRGVLKGSKLERVRVSGHGRHEIQINGVLHKVLPLPVQILGKLGTTEDGKIRIEISKIKVLKIPFKGLMDAARVSAADLVNDKNVKGLRIVGDAIEINISDLLPPPYNSGKVSEVYVTPEGAMVEVYGKTHRTVPARKGRSFMQLTGGRVSFGKLIMERADLTLIDEAAGEWLGFDLSRYKEQLVNGDMHMTKASGLEVYIPDIAKLTAPAGR